MRLMKRNLKPVYYCLYLGQKSKLDADGYETGETEIIYGDPTLQMCNVSPATGAIQMELFGSIEDYDKILITDNMDCPIDENTVLYVDESPVRVLRLKLQFPVSPFGNVLAMSTIQNPYEYVVRRVSKSLHHINYAISKVKVS